MKMLFILSGIIIFFWALLYMRFLYKRAKLAYKVKKLCEKRNFTFYKTHPLWFWGRAEKNRCDFYIVAEKTVFSVVLWKNLIKNCTFTFYEGEYTKDYNLILFNLWGQVVKIPLRLRREKCFYCDFYYKIPLEPKKYKVFPIIIMNPCPNDVKLLTTKGLSTIGDGDPVWDATLFSLKSFIGVLNIKEF